VIASFTYAAVQIRNSARAVRAARLQQLFGVMAGAWDSRANNGELCSIVLRGGDDFLSLDRVERTRFRLFLMAYARGFENA